MLSARRVFLIIAALFFAVSLRRDDDENEGGMG